MIGVVDIVGLTATGENFLGNSPLCFLLRYYKSLLRIQRYNYVFYSIYLPVPSDYPSIFCY